MKSRTKRIEIGQTINIHQGDKVVPAQVINLSFGGILLQSDLQPEMGSRINISNEFAGPLAGQVVRVTPENFALSLGESLDSAEFALQSITSEMLADAPPSKNDDNAPVEEDL